MATLRKTTEAQAPLVASFEFDLTDEMEDTSGATTAFSAAAAVFDVMTLPFGSVVIGGDVVVKTASDAVTTNTLKVGDSADDDRYTSAAVNLKTAGRTALTLTGYETAVGPIRLTLAQTGGAATAGNVRVNVHFIVNNRSHENLKTT